MSTIEITLSAANMGPKSTEHDFNAWAAYVAANIDDALDIDATVDQFAFTGRGAESEDRIEGAEDDEEREAVEAWLAHEGWDGFCSAWDEASKGNRRE